MHSQSTILLYYRSYPSVSGDSYVYFYNAKFWNDGDEFDTNERVYGAATLQRRDEATIAFDGFIPNTRKNRGFSGVEYGLDYSYNIFGGDTNSQWAQYSYPTSTENEADRVYPAALWVNADKVCQKVT